MFFRKSYARNSKYGKLLEIGKIEIEGLGFQFRVVGGLRNGNTLISISEKPPEEMEDSEPIKLIKLGCILVWIDGYKTAISPKLSDFR